MPKCLNLNIPIVHQPLQLHIPPQRSQVPRMSQRSPIVHESAADHIPSGRFTANVTPATSPGTRHSTRIRQDQIASRNFHAISEARWRKRGPVCSFALFRSEFGGDSRRSGRGSSPDVDDHDGGKFEPLQRVQREGKLSITGR